MTASANAPWLNFYGDMPHSIDYPKLTIYQLLARNAKEYPPRRVQNHER